MEKDPLMFEWSKSLSVGMNELKACYKDGNWYDDGEDIGFHDDCYGCKCSDGLILCIDQKLTCERPVCGEQAVSIPGQCCPVCVGQGPNELTTLQRSCKLYQSAGKDQMNTLRSCKLHQLAGKDPRNTLRYYAHANHTNQRARIQGTHYATTLMQTIPISGQGSKEHTTLLRSCKPYQSAGKDKMKTLRSCRLYQSTVKD
ncbi:unnamed protein product [Mytilus coruscus]|uniref:VWFC domain-containing protein n=1 Tax=Mytilus coruscus TaxID=42192 RepID=A0A6J8BZ14_MYTCO|nr:unnamed protein product [Mytilus coruscus]